MGCIKNNCSYFESFPEINHSIDNLVNIFTLFEIAHLQIASVYRFYTTTSKDLFQTIENYSFHWFRSSLDSLAFSHLLKFPIQMQAIERTHYPALANLWEKTKRKFWERREKLFKSIVHCVSLKKHHSLPTGNTPYYALPYDLHSRWFSAFSLRPQ